MENSMPEEQRIIKYIRNLFSLKIKLNDTIFKDIRNIFTLKKEIKGIKDIVLRNIKNLFCMKKNKKIFRSNFWSIILY